MSFVASIDLGTNTFRLLVADITASGTLIPLRRERIITRLGEGFHSTGRIKPSAWRRSLHAMRSFSHILRHYRVGDVRAVATGVVRDAENGPEFIRQLERESGIAVTILRGSEEARLTLAGVVASVTAAGRCCVVDIGGGSTELIVSLNGIPLDASSVHLGAVHLCEELLLSDPPSRQERAAITSRITAVFDALLSNNQSSFLHTLSPTTAQLIGTAGTITTLAAIDQTMHAYDPCAINRYLLSRHRVASILERLALMKRDERSIVPGLEAGREDIILAGASILLHIMNRFGYETLTVSDGGLLEGVLLDAGRKRS